MKSIISIPRKHRSTNNNVGNSYGWIIRITFNASTQWGRDLHVSNSPCPNCPRRPSPHVKTICSLVNAIMCEPLTLTYWICYLFNVQEVVQPLKSTIYMIIISIAKILITWLIVVLGGSCTGIRETPLSYAFM